MADSAGLTKLKTDWGNNSFWGTEKGTSVNFGNGTITRGDGNTATYKAFGDNGTGYTFNKDQSVDSIAQGSDDIANAWKGQYGVDARQTASADAPVFNLNTAGMKGASTWSIDPKTMTVAGQLESVLASESPLMTQARTRALQTQNANGRLNSTMAASAADSAMYDKALEIATPDAQMYGRAGEFNAGEQNKFGLQANDQNFQGQMANFNVKANDWSADRAQDRTLTRDSILHGYDRENKNLDNTFTLNRDKVNHGYDVENINLNNTNTTNRDKTLHANELETIGVNNTNTTNRDKTLHGYETENIDKQTTSGNTAAAKTRLYAAKSDFTRDLNAIAGNSGMGPEAKRTAISALVHNYNSIIDASLAELGWSDKAADWEVSAPEEPSVDNGRIGGVPPGVPKITDKAQQTEANFDGNAYLAANPDVASGWASSPWQHWVQYGQYEQRAFPGKAGATQSTVPPGLKVDANGNLVPDPGQDKVTNVINTILPPPRKVLDPLNILPKMPWE